MNAAACGTNGCTSLFLKRMMKKCTVKSLHDGVSLSFYMPYLMFLFSL